MSAHLALVTFNPFGGILDPYWNSSTTRTADELLALARSADPDERQLAAAMYDLPADLVSVLAMDTAPAVAKAALMQHSAPEEVLAAAAAAHPEWASQIALHDNAPVHLLVDRPAAYFEEPAPRNRFFDAVGATEPERGLFEAKRLDIGLRQDSSRTVGEIWAEVRG